MPEHSENTITEKHARKRTSPIKNDVQTGNADGAKRALTQKAFREDQVEWTRIYEDTTSRRSEIKVK